ncbi:hypothetical protein FEM33_01725 [Dyadobacter flavalbus]|uniref:Prophage tail endopeptidase domain-containing protein n=1 Tax=Dyadobacter flavalbus TaxID=2579942 RepID=A0A5M8R2D3_9BACT|nr:hypothetical protein [Dyadobacter flavalbus]KAA6441480.1 hypothetical protein FEM33_01725 [Dyadobacter flavalbus]
MEQITIIQPDGTLYPVKRLYPLTTITKAVQSCDLLGQDVVDVDFESTEHLEMVLGMKIEVFGNYYTLNVLPEEQKTGSRKYLYKCRFEGVQYELLSSQYFDADATGTYRGSEFSLTGNLDMFISVLIYNCNRTFGPGKWLKGDILETDVKTLTFSTANCLEALQQTICKEFEVEFEILQNGNVKTINVGRAGQILTDVYEYGQGRGLYTLTRRSVKESTIVTRLYPSGSSDNLKPGYRNFSTRLKIGEPGSGTDYIEDTAAIAAFGLIEGSKTFDEVKPQRIGVVTQVGLDAEMFFDSTMNFDLNESDENGTKYLIAGKSAKIHFNTGNLAGYEFELADGGYTPEVKAFVLVPFKDEQGVKFPGPAPFNINVGDQYVILDITMPEIYVTTAEAELRTKARLYLDANKSPLVQYSLDIDPQFLRNKTAPGTVPNFFSLGDFIQIKDADLNINKASRVIRFTRDVLSPFKYTIEIADSYQISTISRVLSDVKQLNNIVTLNDLRNPVTAKQNWKSARELINESFDPDGYLKDGKIKAETLEAAIALFGTEGQQFQIINAVFMPNFQGNKNVLRYTAGQLVHLTIEKDNIRTWNFNAQTVTFGDNNFKFVYAKCSVEKNTATILFSDQQIKTKQDPVHYHFLMGMLNSVDTVTNTRQISLTYGFTLISGRWITTGQIKSSDGSTYFDLDTGEIGGNITFRGTDGKNKSIKQLETELLAQIDAVTEQTDGKVDNWFLNGTPTLSNEPAINWNTLELKTEHVGDNYFDNVSKKSYRFRVENNVFSWEEVSDDRITQALLLASQAKESADGKSTIFISSAAHPTPFPPYSEGDLWTNGVDLFRCITERLTGSYNQLDWELATVYDSTVATIIKGIITAGTIQLAGEGGSVLAGITGNGTAADSVRFWAGAGFANRALAPFRVLQSGEGFLRKRLEMMNENNIGQAGIAGSNNALDGLVRLWAGAPYANRNNAPWRALADGSMFAEKGMIGKWTIQGGGIINDSGDAYIIMRSTDATEKTEVMIGSNVFPGTYGGKGAALFRATEPNSVGDNYGAVFYAKNAIAGFLNWAIYAFDGISFLGQSLINGKKSLRIDMNNQNLTFDPSLYDMVYVNPTGERVCILILRTTGNRFVLGDGKTITIINRNNAFNNLFLPTGTMAVNDSPFLIQGGMAVTLSFDIELQKWWAVSLFDNN